jgi:hypothetical protein
MFTILEDFTKRFKKEGETETSLPDCYMLALLKDF